jgi:hypothetical protein
MLGTTNRPSFRTWVSTATPLAFAFRDPHEFLATAGLQFGLLQARRFAEAEVACRRSLELEPTWTARRVLGLVLKRLDERRRRWRSSTGPTRRAQA